ncbi:hypothetical protein [Butyrivibrio proteoclasticus]|uniref:hypothetical protein n=1 Tax=Butyrivibrio proteoclasticus TaxID=43305 RepID=UPI00047D4766|nr:hypothetical protein [Butyrivibrio proteoclasticus]
MKTNFDSTNENAVKENEICKEEKESAEKNAEALEELIKLSRKQLFYRKIGTLCLAGILVVVVIAVMILIPKVTITLDHINSVAVKAEESLANVDTMAADVSNSAANFDKLLAENSKELTESIKKISEIDFEGLNTAIKDLQDAVGPMASFMNKFR